MPAETTPDAVSAALDRELGRIDRRRGELGPPTVLVDAPDHGLRYAHGDVDRAFHAASVGKLVAAALAGQLVDEGELAADTRIAEVLPAGTLDGLYVHRGVDHGAEVTVEHLLAHTSGVDDFFEGRHGLEKRLVERPDEFWTAGSLLDWVRENQAPVAEPGRRYRYSDTGFTILGLVLEAVTGTDYAVLAHERVFAPLGMEHARIHLRSAPAAGGTVASAAADLATAWLHGVEVTGFRSVSCDAGPQGGLVATPGELARLVRALVAGDLVAPATRDWLARPRNRFRRGIHYGAGVMEVRMGELAPFMGRMPRAVGHIGVLATHAHHVPECGADVVLNFHSTAEMGRSFRVLAAVLQQLRRLSSAGATHP